MNDSNLRVPSFITVDTNNGPWTHVDSKKKSTTTSKPTSNTKLVTAVKIVNTINKKIIPKQHSSQSDNARKLEEADGPIKLKTLSMEMRQEITNRRVSKQWTQADLNKFCSFPQHTIREIESGRLPPNQQQLTVLNRVLKGGIHYS